MQAMLPCRSVGGMTSHRKAVGDILNGTGIARRRLYPIATQDVYAEGPAHTSPGEPRNRSEAGGRCDRCERLMGFPSMFSLTDMASVRPGCRRDDACNHGRYVAFMMRRYRAEQSPPGQRPIISRLTSGLGPPSHGH